MCYFRQGFRENDTDWVVNVDRIDGGDNTKTWCLPSPPSPAPSAFSFLPHNVLCCHLMAVFRRSLWYWGAYSTRNWRGNWIWTWLLVAACRMSFLPNPLHRQNCLHRKGSERTLCRCSEWHDPCWRRVCRLPLSAIIARCQDHAWLMILWPWRRPSRAIDVGQGASKPPRSWRLWYREVGLRCMSFIYDGRLAAYHRK